jgi:hypothetical protein
MAQCLRFVCNKCGFPIGGWDDGNPYIEFPKGKRTYFYHPSGDEVIQKVGFKILGYEPGHEEIREILTKYAGNAPDHICRDCEKTSKIDPDKDAMKCRKCKSEDIEEIYNLSGKKCLKCDGQFSQGESFLIS